jgi:hypothetical protein
MITHFERSTVSLPSIRIAAPCSPSGNVIESARDGVENFAPKR